MFTKGHRPAQTGKSTTVDPICSLEDLARVQALVQHDVRLRALLALALNTALRASDLVSLKWSDITHDGSVIVQERKTHKRRVVPLNDQTLRAVRAWEQESNSAFIFTGQRGVLTVGSWGRQVKDLCQRAGLQGKFASHTCRKTFVRIQHEQFGTSLSTLMFALNHSSERQTLAYCGRLGDDLRAAYQHAL